MAANRVKPPVLVLGIDTPIGLTVVRELGERGVPVYGVARDREAVGLWSRYLAEGFMRPAGEEATLGLLNDIAERKGARFLLTISENDALMSRRAADRGAFRDLRPLVPELRQLELVNDKMATYRVAEELNVPVPSTWQPESVDEIAERAETIGYPCVLKWRDPKVVAAGLSRIGQPLLKAEYCYDPSEMRAALLRYAPLGKFPLVQTFCPGGGLGQMLFLHRGEVLLRFQHRRMAEWPPEGGVSTVCRSLPLTEHSDLMRQSELLLRRIGWEGPAMVEYRYDDRTGRAALMEVNGRFWGSLPLAYHAGAHFAWLTYSALGLGRHERAEPPYRAGIQCRYMLPETKRLLVVCCRRSVIQNRDLQPSKLREIGSYLWGFLRPGGRYYLFSARDPMPFVADAAQVVSKIVKAVFGRVAALQAHSRAPTAIKPPG